LQLTIDELAVLAAAVSNGEHTPWAGVITDIADRYAAGMIDNAGDVDEARRRRAKAGLRRWVEVRDRYCTHPMCRMPAVSSDQDHRVDFAAGGLTTEENLTSVCRHDHRLKHDGGWAVLLSGDGREVVWVSPLGHRYTSRPPPVMTPLPEAGNYYPELVNLPRRRGSPRSDGPKPVATPCAHVSTTARTWLIRTRYRPFEENLSCPLTTAVSGPRAMPADRQNECLRCREAVRLSMAGNARIV
jgi:hypothetical protein